MAIEEITKRGVLIVDRPHMASLIAAMLRSLGRKDIREVTDANRAMLDLRRRTFDMLIIDENVVGLDGTAFTKRLRAQTDCQNRLVPSS
ncbi:MAG: response regulator [Candidatus Devosia euplotis]|nr:response regulator [Candidatus Devosia euplotis]